MSIWSEIRNDFFDDIDGVICIDAWETDDGDEEGVTIATVNIATYKVDYNDKRAKRDVYAQEVIKETVSLLRNGEYFID